MGGFAGESRGKKIYMARKGERRGGSADRTNENFERGENRKNYASQQRVRSMRRKCPSLKGILRWETRGGCKTRKRRKGGRYRKLKTEDRVRFQKEKGGVGHI